jgi:3-isopropylmalate/(R)-2-methylmalate dehydratase small subunit
MSRALKYGDNVDTDVIIPARYLNTTDRATLARHAMEDIDPDFLNKLSPGDLIVAGKNFGCGSSREHAPIVLKECGVSFIIAKSFARIFYRNALNIGLAIIESPEAADEIAQGDTVVVDVAGGFITNETQGGKTYKVAPFPEFLQEIIKAGGLAEVVKQGVLK